ncbi:hypothetical protein ABTQ33_00965 [Paucilactobacillus suebicus]|uniref:Uncharacterized protein n=1 Tax=Paucilactobacillus suebicus DSM 5007 = KCTC 3549 TaxID=1423807 RepID=A0A0R1W7Z9_9LACO|nr:hypothetical protein [Paucilactobacillus suebicus]KRM12004.1 hypothetical protein FD16_GL000373 [Paucilactobacillus suebicus DSM 5007 = KCTC 3549]
MINTRKNIVINTILMTIILIFFTITTVSAQKIIKLTPLLNTVIMIIYIAALIWVIRRQRIHRHRVKILDFKENGYPMAMNHNDEREWRMMLTAAYISQRVQTVIMLIFLVIPFFFPSNVNLLSKDNLLLYGLSSPLITLLVGEWAYALVYLHLDK